MVLASLIIITSGIILSTVVVKAEAKNSTKSTTENSTIGDDALKNSLPTTSLSPSTLETEDAEYAATIAALESLGYSTEHYAERHEKIEQYRKELIDKGCQEINLEACSNWLYAIDNCGYFADPSFIYPEKTKLSNYVSRDEVIEFGKTGKVDKKWNWKVVYHKDENGKLTNEPGLMYAFNPENKVFDIKYVQSPIDSWEKIAPGFFRTLNDNNTWVLFRNDATDLSNSKFEICKYGRSIIYDNSSSRDAGDFKNFLYKMVYLNCTP